MSDITLNLQPESRTSTDSHVNVWGLIGAFVAYDMLRIVSNSLVFITGIGILFIAASFYFIQQDRKLLQAQYNRAPSIWWALLSIVYIWKRTTITNQGRKLFWQAIGIGVASVTVTLAAILAISMNTTGTDGASASLPACSSNVAMRKMESLANQTPVMQKLNASVLKVHDAIDYGFKDGIKFCRGTIDITTGEHLYVVLAVQQQGDNLKYVASLAHQ